MAQALDRTTFAINGSSVTQPEGGAFPAAPAALMTCAPLELPEQDLGEGTGVAAIPFF